MTEPRDRDPGRDVERDPRRQLPAGSETDPARLLPEEASPDSTHPTAPLPPHHPGRGWQRTGVWFAGILVLLLLYAAGMAIHDERQERSQSVALAARLTGGDPAQGRMIMSRYGCAQCHTIPGVTGARGRVGPPLAGIASRMYIAGVLTNTPEHMVQWIMNPKAVDPLTAMPDVGLTEAQARHVAAYLYTLR